MTTKHTPGPWLVHDKSTLHMNDATIAEVGRYLRVVTHNRGPGIDGMQVQRNAALIAAAPDLLAACKLLVNLRHGSSNAEISRAIDDGVSAIAKAER